MSMIRLVIASNDGKEAKTKLKEVARGAAEGLWNFQTFDAWSKKPEELEKLGIADLSDDDIDTLDRAREILNRYTK